MIKKLVILLVCFLLVGCSATKKLDPQEVSQKLAMADIFDDTLELQSEKMAKKILKIKEEVEEVYLYVGTGALAERIVVIKGDEKTLEKLSEQFLDENYSLQQSYASYNPGEVSKLEYAILSIKEDVLVYVVSKDSEAVNKIINDSLK